MNLGFLHYAPEDCVTNVTGGCDRKPAQKTKASRPIHDKSNNDCRHILKYFCKNIRETQNNI